MSQLPAARCCRRDAYVPGVRRGDYADASLETSSSALVLEC